MVKTSQVVAAASVVSVAMTVAHAKTVVIVAAVIAMIVAVVTVTTVVLVKIVAHAKTVLLGVTDQWKCLSRLSLTAKCAPSSVTLVPTLVVVATVVETAIAIVAVAK
jgi:ubiquitin C-terminal hydrolase